MNLNDVKYFSELFLLGGLDLHMESGIPTKSVSKALYHPHEH